MSKNYLIKKLPNKNKGLEKRIRDDNKVRAEDIMNRILATLFVGIFLFLISAGMAETAQPGRYLPITYWPPGYISTENTAGGGSFCKEYPAAKLPSGFSYSRVYLGGHHSVAALTSQEAAEKAVAHFITNTRGKSVALGDSGGAQVRETAGGVYLRAICCVKNVLISVDINQWEFKPSMSRGGRATYVTLVPKPSLQEVMDLAHAWVTAATAYARDQGLFSGTPGIGQTPQVTQVKVQPAEPIVVVVHGIGLGESRSRGWSAWQSECWGITSNMVEITHNPPDIMDSLKWANDVKREFDKILIRKKKENRPVMIIAHSWGSVMAKVVLGGGKIIGMDDKTTVFLPMDSGWVDVWITLGSPIGRTGRYYYYGKPEVDYGTDKPPQVLYWANFYSANDVVGSSSSALKTPDLNSHVEVDDEKRAWLFAKYKLDPDWHKWTVEQMTKHGAELTKAQELDVALPHVGIWYCKPVVSYVRYQYAELKKRAEALASRSGKTEP